MTKTPRTEDKIMNTTGWDEARRRIAAEREAQTGFLNLGNLGLVDLPPELFELDMLVDLNLGEWYKDESGEFQISWETYGQQNRIALIPIELARLSRLRRLSLTSNPVIDLVPLKAMISLESLNCSATGIADLTALTAIKTLQSLECTHTSITDLAPVAALSHLQSLDCSNTKISDLSPLVHLSTLESLDCTETRISDLAPLTRMTTLQSLSCWATDITDLAPLAGLTSLRSLHCWSTQVSSLVPLKNLTAMQWLDCSNTQIDNLSPLTGFAALLWLDCSNTEVSDLTPLRRLTSLLSLNCSHTDITDLTPLKGLTSLQSLHFRGTNVSCLTPLNVRTTLQALDCSKTHVSDLSPLQGLTALRSLNCRETMVSSLGPLMGLTSLSSLNCARTKITDLTPLNSLTALQSLDCSSSSVTDLAPLPKLVASSDNYSTQLNASGCVLDDLPPALVRNPDLKSLFLFETRVPGLPNEVLSQDPRGDNCLDRVRAHVDDLEAGTVPLRTTKIIVLGNGRVGKTQLCRRLRGLDYDPNVPSTHGITIASAAFDGEETLNLWDFGGQDIYHGVHALFMRTRAVFVIAWQPAMEASPTHTYEGITFHNHPLIYWLEFVRAMGAAGSPIIVVQCQCEHRRDELMPLPVDPATLAGSSVIPVQYSANTDRGRDRLNEAIEEAIAALRARDGLASIGQGRARVIEQLEKWRFEDEARAREQRMHRTLTREAFRAVCTAAGGVSSPEALLHYLHNSGLIFHDAERFGDRILLDQTWALDAVYTVFDRQRAWRHLQATHGRFTRSLLEATVWKEYPADDQRLFLTLMLSCGICFRHRGEQDMPRDDDEYIAPDLLPDANIIAEHLAGRWDEGAPTRRLVYAYEFLHPGLFRGLMSEIGQQARSAGVYWRTGLWLYAPKSRARARIDLSMEVEPRGRITLAIQGEDLELVKWLRERFAAQHQRFGQSGLKPVVDELPVTFDKHEPAPAPIATAPRREEPEFAQLPPADFKREEPNRPQVFISYAWKDGKRAAIGLEAALVAQGIDVHRDRTDTKTGDSVSAFMDRLVRGDFVFVIISEAYLRSEACMYEIFGIWRRAKQEPERFLTCVIPIVLPGAHIAHFPDRFAHAKYWHERYTEYGAMIQECPELAGGEDFANFKKISDYRLHTSDILCLLNDRLTPRDLDELERTDFAEVIALVRETRP